MPFNIEDAKQKLQAALEALEAHSTPLPYGEMLVWFDEPCPLYGDRLVGISPAAAIAATQRTAAEKGVVLSEDQALQDFLTVHWAWLAPKRTRQADFAGKTLRLCFVKNSFAYFCEDFHQAWGDDWDDAPYEHNAGLPYEVATILAFRGNFSEPCDTHHNSPWSVQQINAGAVAWLTGTDGNRQPVAIHAGASLFDFVRLVQRAGGTVYFPRYEDIP